MKSSKIQTVPFFIQKHQNVCSLFSSCVQCYKKKKNTTSLTDSCIRICRKSYSIVRLEWQVNPKEKEKNTKLRDCLQQTWYEV